MVDIALVHVYQAEEILSMKQEGRVKRKEMVSVIHSRCL